MKMIKEKIPSITAKKTALSYSPSNTELYISKDMVFVFPAIFPPIINVIPTSPNILPVASIRPEMIFNFMFGITTNINVSSSLFPRV